MCFKRNPTLGRYNGTRSEWREAYRNARVDAREGREPDPAFDGIRWKAGLIVAYERERMDHFALPLVCRLEAIRVIEGY